MSTNANSITLPPIDLLAKAAEALVLAAQEAGDRARVNALNKAAYHLHQGVAIISTTGGFLIASGTREGVIHRVSNLHGCSCEAGANDKACWHRAVLEIVEHAQRRTVPTIEAEQIGSRYRAVLVEQRRRVPLTAASFLRPDTAISFATEQTRRYGVSTPSYKTALAEIDELYA
jgi:hypothetical protein